MKTKTSWLELVIAACLYYSGLVWLACRWRQYTGNRVVILNYHRASGGDLRRHLLYLKRAYRILHLEAALEELYGPSSSQAHQRRGKREKDRRIPLVLTFDDGYCDSYTHAFALAQELQVPLTIFLIPGYIESGRRFWWHEGEYLASQARVKGVSIEGHTYHLHEPGKREALAQCIDAHVRHATSVAEREQFLRKVHEAVQMPLENAGVEKETRAIRWEEAREMLASGWVSFGAHTMHHPILAYLADDAEVRNEVRKCREVLEQQLGQPVRTFAYPVGQPEHISLRGKEAVKQAGYTWAVTTMHGCNTRRSDPYMLRRVVVDVNQHWLAVAAKACGLWSFLSRLRSVYNKVSYPFACTSKRRR